MKINGVEEDDVEALRTIAKSDGGILSVLSRVLLAIIEPAKSGREKVETQPE